MNENFKIQKKALAFSIIYGLSFFLLHSFNLAGEYTKIFDKIVYGLSSYGIEEGFLYVGIVLLNLYGNNKTQ